MGTVINGKIAYMIDSKTEKAFYYCGAWYLWERDFYEIFVFPKEGCKS